MSGINPFDATKPSRLPASIHAQLISHEQLVRPPEEEPRDGKVCLHGTPQLNPKAWARHVPLEILEAIEKAEKILVVGDEDADGSGSEVGLTRTLRAIGKHAVAYCRSAPPIEMKPLLEANEVESGPIDEHYDLVIHVDQGGDRVGKAAARATANAEQVVVLDHHDITPDPSHLSWIDTGADAAALLVLGVIIRLVERAKVELTPADWRRILTPIVAAIGSDTRGLEADRTRPTTYGIVNYVADHAGVNVRSVLEALDPFSDDLKEFVRTSLEQHLDEAPPPTGIIVAHRGVLHEVLERAKRERPGAKDEDAFHLIVEAAERAIAEKKLELSMLVVDRGDYTKLSTRAAEGSHAIGLANAFGGSGKPGEGGARLEKKPLREIVEEGKRLMREWRSDPTSLDPEASDLAHHVAKWRLGSI